MKKIISSIALFFLITSVITPQPVLACGCGLALTNDQYYQSLAEPEAYLVVKAFDEKTFELQPYFRLYSTDPKIGTIPIVFPIDQIPAKVTGKKMRSYEFQQTSGISAAHDAHEKFVNAQIELIRALSAASAIVEQGFIATSLFNVVTSRVGSLPSESSGLQTATPAEGAVAHFDFEGGTLDVFDPATMGTLGSFASSLNTELAPAVEKMVKKYDKSYIAVMNLQVPNVQSDTGEGNLVSMRFENADHFFYPTSLTSAYAQPVPNLGYYLSMPAHLQPKLANSVKTEWTARVEDQRWYRVNIPGADDLRGSFTKSSPVSYLDDAIQSFIGALAPYASQAGTLFFILLTIIIALLLIRIQKEKRTRGFLIASTCLYAVGGLFLLFPIAFLTKRWRLGFMLLGSWCVLLVPTLAWVIMTISR